MSTKKASEKFILKQSMHLGCIKQTFGMGTIMEKIVAAEGSDTIFIDGKPYKDTRDFDILVRHGWLLPFSKEVHETLIAKRNAPVSKPAVTPKAKAEDKAKMKHLEVIECDSDLNEDIDISHTKTPKKEHNKDKKASLEVIKGDGIEDETPEERVRRKQTEIPKMPIVEDETLNADGRPSLNAGMVKTISPELAAKKKAEAASMAAAYKADIAKKKAMASAAQTVANAVVVASGGKVGDMDEIGSDTGLSNAIDSPKKAVTVTECDLSIQTVEQAAVEEATGESGTVNMNEMFEDAGQKTSTLTTPTIKTATKLANAELEPQKRRGRPKGAKNKVKEPAAN